MLVFKIGRSKLHFYENKGTKSAFKTRGSILLLYFVDKLQLGQMHELLSKCYWIMVKSRV